MLREDQTCPQCGALVTPQLDRCRQCGRYLHGSKLEGLLVETLLPKSLSSAPGTGFVALYAMLYYLLMVLLTGPGSLAGFRPLALLQLGMTTSTEVQDLEPWRFVMSVFTHGSLLHIVFNLYALTIVGPLVERLHDRKRIIVFFVLTGAISMWGSYAYRMVLLDQAFFMGSVGASGAVSGLLGVAWVATRKPTCSEREAHPLMTRWIVLLLLWGVLPGIDGAAHFVGMVAGGLLGWLVPEGPPERRTHQRLWTAAVLASIAAVLASTALTLAFAKDQPYRLEDDAYPRDLLFFTLEPGTPFPQSGQYAAIRSCSNLATEAEARETAPAEAIEACELAIRAVPSSPGAHLLLGRLLSRSGNEARGQRQIAIARRLGA